MNYLSMNTENVCFHKTIKQHNCFFPSYIHWVIGVGLDLAALDKHWQKHPSKKKKLLHLLQILLSHNIYMFLKTHTDEDFESCNNFCWNDRSFDRQMASDLGFFWGNESTENY